MYRNQKALCTSSDLILVALNVGVVRMLQSSPVGVLSTYSGAVVGVLCVQQDIPLHVHFMPPVFSVFDLRLQSPWVSSLTPSLVLGSILCIFWAYRFIFCGLIRQLRSGLVYFQGGALSTAENSLVLE